MWKGNRQYLSDLDWKRAALQAICDGGIAAVAVEPLARSLGVSKGSFYWHFNGRDDLLRGALELWEQEEADRFIASIAAIADPRERIRQLIGRVSRGSWNCTLHSALSAAADDPIVKPVLQRVSGKRLGYLERCYRELGFDEASAAHRARLGYTVYVGFIHLSREAACPIDPDYIAHIADTLIPPAGSAVTATAVPEATLAHGIAVS
jgi:AcrR family transcriptional regulator